MRLLPSALRSRLESALQTSASNADPRMEIFLGRTSDIITATERFLVRTVRSGAGLGALSLAAERPDPTKGPTRLWMVSIQNGVAQVATAPMPFGAGPSWTWQYTVGPAIDVAVALDGVWDDVENSTYVYTSPPKSRFVHYTKGLPWLFRVTATGELVAQQGQNGQLTTLANGGVTKVSAIRGWKNTVIGSMDHGVIAAYVRSGQLYYRNYAEQEIGGLAWEQERLLPELSDVVHVSLFRTSDYRVGFLIGTTGGSTRLVMSARNWAGMAISPETVRVGVSGVTVEFLRVQYQDALHAENVTAGLTPVDVTFLFAGDLLITHAANDGGERVVVDFNSALLNYAGQESAWKLIDCNGVRFSVISISAGTSDRQLVLFMQDFNNAVGDVTVAYDSSVGSIIGEAGQALGDVSRTFQPIGLIPVQMDPPALESVSFPSNSGTQVDLHFDSDILDDPAGNELKFAVTGQEVQGNRTVQKTYTVSSVAYAQTGNKRIIRLTTAAFNNASGSLSIACTGASLRGHGGYVADFVWSQGVFGLRQTAFNHRETIRPSILVGTLTHLRVYYTDSFHSERVIVSLVPVVTFAKVGEVNP